MPVVTLNVVQPANLQTPDFEIGTRITGKITMRGSVVVDVAEDNTAKTVTYTHADGSTKVISMAALDIYLDEAASFWDATTNVITLKQKNGGADVAFNLDDLQKSTVTAGAGVTLSGDGSDANPLKADAVIDPASSTALSVSAAGLKLDPAALTVAVTTGIATTMSGNGSAATPLKTDVTIDPTSDASLTASAAGLKLDTALLLPITLTDAFGTAIGMIGMAAAAPPPAPLTTTMNLNAATTAGIAISTSDGSSYTVDWGDGSAVETFASGTPTSGVTHTYSTAYTGPLTITHTAALIEMGSSSATPWVVAASDLPRTLVRLGAGGPSVVSGVMSELPPNLDYIYISNSSLISAPTVPVFTSPMKRVLVAGVNMDATSVDNVLAAAAAITTWTDNKAVSLAGLSAAPTAAGLASKATLEANGVTVTVN